MAPLRFALALVAGLALTNVAAANELNIEDYRWNLDGVGRHEEFNQLTLLVTNQSAKDFDGQLTYVQGSGIAPVSVLKQPLFLAKGQSTRVVFDVYFTSYIEEGRVRWGRRDDQSFGIVSPNGIWSHQRFESDKELAQLPPVAWLVSGIKSSPSVGGAVRELPARWVPISAAALPIDSVVALSADPALQPAQRQALADWVKMGGTIYVFRDGDRYDDYSDELSFLNLNVPRQAVGRGLVVRDEREVRDLRANDWRQMAIAAHPERTIIESNNNYGNDVYSNLRSNFAENVYRAFSLVHRPKVIWPLVFLLFFVYIAAILFGGIFVSKKTRDWKATYGTLAVLIVFFSAVFWFVGARGHGEESESMTVALVDVVDSGENSSRARIRGWTQYFTTYSGQFELKPVDGRMAFHPREFSERQTIVDGPEGLFVRRVPVFASASFAWQGIANVTAPRVIEATSSSNGRQVTVELAGVSDSATVRLISRGRLTALRPTSDGRFKNAGWGTISIQQQLQPQPYQMTSGVKSGSSRDEVRRNVLDTGRKWIQQVGAFTDAGVIDSVDDAGVLLVTDELPAELKSTYGEGVIEHGVVLYRIPVRFKVGEIATSESATSESATSDTATPETTASETATTTHQRNTRQPNSRLSRNVIHDHPMSES